MGARRGNALSRSGRFTRIGRGSNSSSTSKPDTSKPGFQLPNAVRGGGGIDYGYGEADTPIYRIPGPQPISPTPGRRGPIATTLPVPAPTRPDQRVQPDRVVDSSTSRRPTGRAPKERVDNTSKELDAQQERINNTSREFRNTRVPSQSLDAQTKLLQTEDAQYARNRAVAAQLDAAQQQLVNRQRTAESDAAQQRLDNTGGRVGGIGVMGRPDSDRNTRVPSQSMNAQIQLLQNEDAEYAKNKEAAIQAKAKEMNRGIATRTVSFGGR